MTPRDYIILILAAACAVLAWIAFAPADEVPDVDPQRYRLEERLEAKEREADALRDSLEAATARIDTVWLEAKRNTAKHDSIAKVRLSQSDSVQAVVLKQRLQ